MTESRGKKMRDLMRQRGLTQGQLASLCDVSQARISQLMTDKDSDPSVDLLIKLSEAFNVAKDYFIDSTQIPKDGIEFLPIIALSKLKIKIVPWESEQYGFSFMELKNIQAVGEIDAPSFKDECYAIKMASDIPASSFSQEFKKDDCLIFSQKIKPVSNDYVIVQSIDEARLSIKRFVKEGEKNYLLPLLAGLPTIEMDTKNKIIGVVFERRTSILKEERQ